MISNDIYSKIAAIPDNMEIAIWGLNIDSFSLLTKAINERKKISYFVNSDNDFVDVFGKKVITKDDLLNNGNIFLLINKIDYMKIYTWINHHLKERYCVIDINALSEDIIRSQSLYIYGAGKAGKRTQELLKSNGVAIKGFLDSDKNKIGEKWCGYSIYDKNVLEKGDIVIISSIYYQEIYSSLCENLNEKFIFIDYRNSISAGKMVNCSQMDAIWITYKEVPVSAWLTTRNLYVVLWNDFCNKKIIIYGNNEITEQIVEIFELLNIQIEYIVDEEYGIKNEKYLIKDVYGLAYEDLKDTIILVTKINILETEKTNRIVIDSGRVLESLDMKFFSQYRPLPNITYANRWGMEDKLLDYINLYEGSSKKYPGFYVFGNENTAKKRIVILGGSACDSGIYENLIVSWPEILSRKYKDAVIYNGGMAGYDSVRECLKLLRDVIQLKPDLIISYSGVNENENTRRTDMNPFAKELPTYYNENMCYGLRNDITMEECWILMERYMHSIAKINNSEFIAILQPAFVQKKPESYSRVEKLQAIISIDNFAKKYLDVVKYIRTKMPEYEWMYDLTEIFSNDKNYIYRDGCHLTEYGNGIIAEEIYNIINDYYKKRNEVFI